MVATSVVENMLNNLPLSSPEISQTEALILCIVNY